DVRHFAMRTRTAAGLFIGGDMPEELSAPAAEIDDWAAAMPRAQGLFDALRKLKTAASAGINTAAELADAASQLSGQLDVVRRMVGEQLAADPREILRQLPPAAGLQKAQGSLRALLLKGRQKLAAGNNALAALAL